MALVRERVAAGPAGPRPAAAGHLRLYLAAIVFGTSFWYRFQTLEFANDHFLTILEGRQILVYHELPVRDFADPGYTFMSFASAAAQLVFGYSLLGEAILSLLCLSAGATLTYLLASHISRSTAIGLGAALLVVAMFPRLYHYPKMLLPVLGLWLCWRYADRPTLLNLGLLAGGTALAFLVRHDHVVYVGMAAGVALIARHWHDGARMLAGRLAFYGCATGILVLPFFAYLELNGGTLDYFRSALDYTRSEAQRQNTFPTPPFVWGDIGNFRKLNAIPWLYYLSLSLPVVAVAWLILKHVKPTCGQTGPSFEAAKVLSVAVLCAVSARLLLREPLQVRLPDVAAPVSVVGAWLLSQWLSRRGGFAALRWIIAISVLAITWASVDAVIQFERQLRVGQFDRGPRDIQMRAADLLQDLRASPPSDDLLPTPRSQPLIRYIRACTRPSDRLFVTQFQPDLTFYSERAFAGDQFFFYLGYRTSPEDQQRFLSRLRAQSVPIVLAKMREYHGEFDVLFDLIHQYLTTHYQVARELTLDRGVVYRVLVDPRITPTRTYEPLSLPCYA